MTWDADASFAGRERLGEEYDGFYEAALGNVDWTEAIGAIGARMAASSGLLFSEHDAGQIELLGAPGWSARALRLYAEHWYRYDPYAAHARRHPADACFLGEEIVPEARLRESPIWQDFGRHELSAIRFIGVQRRVGDGTTIRLSWHRPADAPPFAEVDRAVLSAASCHLRRARQLRARLSRAERASGAAEGPDPTVGSVVATGSRRCRYANGPAERLAQGPTLRLSPELRLGSRNADVRFGKLLADEACGGPGGGLMVGAAEGAGHLAILVTLLPAGRVDAIRTIGPPLPPDQRSVLVTIRLLGEARPLPASALQGRKPRSSRRCRGASASALSQRRAAVRP